MIKVIFRVDIQAVIKQDTLCASAQASFLFIYLHIKTYVETSKADKAITFCRAS